MKVRHRHTAQERQSILAELQASDLTIAEFARQKRLRADLLAQWVHRYVRRSLSVAVVAPGDCPGSAPAVPLREVRLGDVFGQASWAAELALPGGVVVRLDGAGQTRLLEHLLSRGKIW